MNPKRQRLVVVVLGVFLLASLAYIVNDQFQESRSRELQQVSAQGYSVGVSDALNAAYLQTENCQVTTITLGNVTRQIVDFACVQELLQQQGGQ